jgi:hypothetical protein
MSKTLYRHDHPVKGSSINCCRPIVLRLHQRPEQAAMMQLACVRRLMSGWAVFTLLAAWSAATGAQAASAGKLTIVSTAEQLRAALAAGDAHIEIVEHLDLTKLPPNPDTISYGSDLFEPLPTTRSIVVRPS